MIFYKKIVSYLLHKKPVKIDAVKGYNKWAATYDNEIEMGNVTVFYNDILVKSLLSKINFAFEFICDFGAGTGRHYKRIMNLKPKRWVGCDTSPAMLKKLKLNNPEAETHILTDHVLSFAKDSEIDFIFSSLTIGHIKKIDIVFTEWNRVLKKGGNILLTLFHPNLGHLKTARSFKNSTGKTYAIEHYKHSIPELHSFFKKNNWEVITFEESIIGDEIKSFLEKNNLSKAYTEIKGNEIVCGFILKKNI